MSYWFIYLFTRLEMLNNLFIIATCISGACFVVLGVMYGLSVMLEEKDNPPFKKESLPAAWVYVRRAMLLFLACLIPLTLIPTTKEAAVIYLLPKIVNSETSSELAKVPPNLAKLLNNKMEQWLEDVDIREKMKEPRRKAQ